jgi:apolipoprotein N-acyltransferase
LAGLLLAASFPLIGISGFAWIAPGLICATAAGKRGWETFRIGYVAGLVHYLVMLYWLLLIPYRWHGIPFGPAAGWLALSGYVALYPAVWVWMLSTFDNPMANGGLSRTWTFRTAWSLAGAAIWVGLEMVVVRLFSGFPWDLLGVSQYQLVPLIQIAAFTGVYGVSFLVVWVSLSLLSAATNLMRHPASRSLWLADLFLPLLVTAAVFAGGYRKLSQPRADSRVVKVTLIQPSIPQTLIWDSSRDEERFQALLRLSADALTNQTDLLLWPEAAVPKLLRYDKDTFEAVTGLARSNHVWMIIGADDAERRAKTSGAPDADFYNSSFLISPEGKLVDRYRKRSLVIFGEYVPLARWLPFMKWFTPVEGGFTPGDRAAAFELADLDLKLSVLICFEDIFPQIGRESAASDIDLLVNLTNNGWFGESAAQWQHAVSGLFRAVENDVPLVRCSNNGLTCWVDRYGRLRRIFHDGADRVYGAGIMRLELPLAQSRVETFYHRHGDWFGWSCVAIAGATLLARVLRMRARSKAST